MRTGGDASCIVNDGRTSYNCRVAASGRCAASELTFRSSRLMLAHEPRQPKSSATQETLCAIRPQVTGPHKYTVPLRDWEPSLP